MIVHRIGMAVNLFLALSLLLIGQGCNILTPVAYVIHGPGKISARYELDPNATTVVFVDDPSSRATDRRIRNLIAQAATATLMKRAKVADMINPTAVLAVASKDSFQNPLSIKEIGQAVEADIVIYVALDKFDMEGPGRTFLPTTTVSVKVIDIRDGTRLWPAGAEGEFIRVGGDYRPGEVPRTSADLMNAEEALATRAGVGIAQLFYKHEITESVTR